MKQATAQQLPIGVREHRRELRNGSIEITLVGPDGHRMINSPVRYEHPAQPDAKPTTVSLPNSAPLSDDETTARRARLEADKAKYQADMEALQKAKAVALDRKDVAQTQLQTLTKRIEVAAKAAAEALIDDTGASIDDAIDLAASKPRLEATIAVCTAIETDIKRRIGVKAIQLQAAAAALSELA